MTAKATPGPWMPYEDRISIGIYMRDDDGTCGPQVAMVLTENLTTDTCDQARADAALIAAAPDLLAACEAALPILRWAYAKMNAVGNDTALDTINQLNAAIAKAKGGQP